jgi:hypothetical protein
MITGAKMVNEDAAIGAVIDALYAMVSGPAGPRDWSGQLDVFHPEARQIRTGQDSGGDAWMTLMDPEDYRRDTAAFFEANGFFEIETGRRIDRFGNIAHVWSHYEARMAADDPIPERRGINSIQLFRDSGGRWRVVAMIWDNERPGLELPPI